MSPLTRLFVLDLEPWTQVAGRERESGTKGRDKPMPESTTSGEIAAALNEASSAAASPAQHSDQPADQTPASARETPAPAGPPDQTSEDRYKGWIPPEAHERVVKGFHERLDAVDWARGLSREEVEDALAAQRAARSRSSQGDEPQPDARDDRGEWYYTPSQAAKWATWHAERLVAERMAEMEARLRPMESAFAQDQKVLSLQQQIDVASTWPGFTEHIDAITNAIADANAKRQRLSLYDAYIREVVTKFAHAKDTLLAEEKKKWLAELNHTSTVVRDEVNPKRAASSSRKPDHEKTTKELFEEELATRRRA